MATSILQFASGDGPTTFEPTSSTDPNKAFLQVGPLLGPSSSSTHSGSCSGTQLKRRGTDGGVFVMGYAWVNCFRSSASAR